MKLNKLNICPKCGGKIIVELFGSYGTIHYLRKDGTVGHKIREVKYEYSGDRLYYCSQCGHLVGEEVWP